MQGRYSSQSSKPGQRAKRDSSARVKESKKPDLVRIVQAKGADRQLFERVKASADIAIGQKQDKAFSPPVEVNLTPIFRSLSGIVSNSARRITIKSTKGEAISATTMRSL